LLNFDRFRPKLGGPQERLRFLLMHHPIATGSRRFPMCSGLPPMSCAAIAASLVRDCQWRQTASDFALLVWAIRPPEFT
jgi:hypothetical protein